MAMAHVYQVLAHATGIMFENAASLLIRFRDDAVFFFFAPALLGPRSSCSVRQPIGALEPSG
jgi:hypothetical protein